MTGQQINKLQQIQHVLEKIENGPEAETIEKLTDRQLLERHPVTWCVKELEEILNHCWKRKSPLLPKQ